jgi:predicted phage terminase large subunit-like protein
VTEEQAIRPQPGAQELFLSLGADVALYGGAAGGGKSFALLLEPLRYRTVPNFGATIFRRTYPQITAQGSLWDESLNLYPLAGGEPKVGDLLWTFASGARVKFAHLQHEETVEDYYSSQIPLIEFDQLEQFSRRQFLRMLARNRSACGVRPYCRATCNPDADSWLAEFVAWWIDPVTGLADERRSGVVRWFVNRQDRIVWGDSREELRSRFPDQPPLSFTFVPAKLEDNPILRQKDPGYEAKLSALPLVEYLRLRPGNWKARAEAGKVFNQAWFPLVAAAPAGGEDCRFWDLASTERKIGGRDPDFTAGVLLRRSAGVYYVLDCVAEQAGPAEVERLIVATAEADSRRSQREGATYRLRWEQEPGSAAAREALRLTQMFAGLDAAAVRPEGDKVVRARAFAAQARAGNVKLVGAEWNGRFLAEMHGFPDRPHDDIPDAASGAMNALPLFCSDGTGVSLPDPARRPAAQLSARW